MEVSGQLAASSGKDFNLYCLPCDRDGLKESAYGYCQDCEEHLCESCYKHHRKPRPSMNHVLLDTDAMPNQPKTENTRTDQITDFCLKHSNKLQEFYCNTHASTACYVCVALEHKLCKVDYIPDVSGSVPNELGSLIEKMENLIKKCKSNVKNADITTANVEQMYEKAIEDIHLYRSEINECLDRMEKKIIKQAKARQQSEKCKQENVKTRSLQILEEMSSSISSLQALKDENKMNHLFIEMKHVGPRVAKISDNEKQLVEDNMPEGDIAFIPNTNILNQLKSDKHKGKIEQGSRPSADRKLHVQYERTFKAQFSSHKEKCNIEGMVLISTTQLVIADFNNKKIKMIDANTGTLISEILVSSGPCDVTILPQNKLAVAIPREKCIQIISYTDKSLSLDQRIHVREECYCVAYCQNKLIVSCNYNPGKLILVDFDGHIIHVFDTPWIFLKHAKIAVSRDEKFIYVTNILQQEINCIKLDWKGNVVQRFEHAGYEGPTGIQELEDGTLLVCYRISHTIERLSNSFKKCEIVGLDEANFYHPRAITYSERDHKLYISCSSVDEEFLPRCNMIKTFNIKWT